MQFNKFCTTLVIILLLINNNLIQTAELTQVHCDTKFIYVEILFPKTDFNTLPQRIFMENLHNNTLKSCHPIYDSKGVSFMINLKDFYKCGFTRVINILMKQAIFYQNFIVEQNGTVTSTFNVKCSYKIGNIYQKPKHKLVKRDVLPDDFKEDDDVEILETLQQQAPEPQVLMEVRQNDQLIDGMVTVIPGTPLVMEVKLNDVASNIYGININYLEVSDTIDMSETILFRGCTVDPYLFENFNISDSHTLKSKFRAFKFPNTAFVQFRANIQICLQKCPAPQCANSQSAQSRKSREVSDKAKNLYEISLNLLMKINETAEGKKDELLKLQEHVELLKIKNLVLRKL